MEGVWIFIGCNGSRSMALRSIYVQQQGLVVGNIMLKRLGLMDRVLTGCSPLCPCPYSCPCPHVGQGPCSAACFPRAATYQASSLQIFSVFFVTLFIKSLRKWRIISFLCSSSPSRCPPPHQTRRCWRSGKVWLNHFINVSRYQSLKKKTHDHVWQETLLIFETSRLRRSTSEAYQIFKILKWCLTLREPGL